MKFMVTWNMPQDKWLQICKTGSPCPRKSGRMLVTA